MGWTPHRDPHSFSAWFEDSFAAIKAVTRRGGWLIALVWSATTALIGVFVVLGAALLYLVIPGILAGFLGDGCVAR